MGSCLGKRRTNPENVIVKTESRMKLINNDSLMNSIYEEYDYLIELDKFLHYEISKQIGWNYTLHGQLNRYPTILPYDYNRVKLINLIKECDYVNASWITGPLEQDENLETVKHSMSLKDPTFISFIASQAPTDKTCVHHLQMILDYSVDIVVALTPVFIDDCETERCHQYWPDEDGESKSFDHISIAKISDETLREDTFKRKLVITSANKDEGSVKSDSFRTRHQFTQFHYIGWPDCAVPGDCKHQIHESDPIVNLLDDVKKEINTEKKEVRILVHCSVGVGRTGTFIAVFKLNEAIQKLKRLQDHNDNSITCSNISSCHDEIIPGLEDKRRKNLKISRGLDIFEVVLSLRCKRMNMVEAPEQYAYLYLYAEMETERELND